MQIAYLYPIYLCSDITNRELLPVADSTSPIYR